MRARAATFIERLRGGGDAGVTRPTPVLPDPAEPPSKRGSWESAALTNVDITEEVKRQIRTRTRPWEK